MRPASWKKSRPLLQVQLSDAQTTHVHRKAANLPQNQPYVALIYALESLFKFLLAKTMRAHGEHILKAGTCSKHERLLRETVRKVRLKAKMFKAALIIRA